MVQAQEWLDKKYPKEIRSNITEINISKNYNILENEYLVGNLKLEGFKNLKKFDCSRNSITNLDMNDSINIKKLKCSSNKIQILKIEKLIKIKVIECENNQIIELNLNSFKNLEKLNCCGNKLKELKINNLNNLELLYCSYNKLINLNLINCLNLNKINCDNNKIKEIKLPLNNQRLEILNLNSNNLLYQDLNIFSKFINLKRLDIGNNEFKERKYNKFYGSLELLKNLEKLEYLEISDTDIDKGLEYLSDSVEEIGCSIFNRGQCGVKKIKDKLCLFVSFEDDGYFTCKFQPWKMLNKLEEKNKQLEKDFEEERSIRISLQDQINEYFQKNLQLQNDLRQIDMENQQLQKKLSNLQIQNINQQSDSIIHQFSAFENQIEEFDDSYQEEEEEEEEGSDCSFEVVSQEIIE
ncbi:L domain-like protein [Rhizophagus irregularis]|uniref:L domain-like protein n=1 Tax=Rhizophagus irregularis TaxID=588596 RepID=A0A2N0SFP5_9GLOM|nr:L domain-like protein [Rhizophagus irregularis]